MKRLSTIFLALTVLAMAIPGGGVWRETVAFAEETYTELYRLDFDDVDTVTATADKSAFNAVYNNAQSKKAELLSPKANFNYTVAPKTEGGTDKYIQLDSDYASNASGYTALQVWLPNGGFQTNNGTYKISFDAKTNTASNKPFLRIKTNHTDNPMGDSVIAANGGIYNWGPCLGGIAPINADGARDQSSANIYGTYSTYEGVENLGWFTASYENETKVNLSLDEWHNSEIFIDTVNGIAYYYFDGIYAGCQKDTTFQKKFICGQYSAKTLQFQIEQGWNVGNGFQLDNIVISHSSDIFDGSGRVTASSAKMIDCTEESLAFAPEMSAIAKKFEIAVSNVIDSTAIASQVTLKKNGVTIPFATTNYVATNKTSGVLTLTTENYLESGGGYTLSALDKEYSFSITYPQMMAIGNLYLAKGGQKVADIATLSASDAVSAEITVLNPTGQKQDATLVAACFDGAELKSVYYKDVPLPATDMVGSVSLPFTVPAATNPAIILYVVDSMQNFAALADPVILGTVTPASGTIFEIGETNLNNKNKTVTLLVYQPDKSFANLAEGVDMSGVIHTIAQTKATEEGVYLFKAGFTTVDTSGVYKAYTNIGNGPQLERLPFVNEDENQTAVTIMLGSTDFVNDAKANAAALGFGEFTDSVPEAAYSILQDYYANNTVDATDVATNRSAARKSEIIACVNAGVMTNLFKCADYLSTETADIAEFFAGSYFTDTLQASITADVKQKNISSISALKGTLNKAFVLNLVATPNGYENIVPVLQKFAGDIGVDSSKVTLDVAQAISGNTYGDYPALKTAIEAVPPPPPPGGGGGGGSFGGGGGSLVGGGGNTLGNSLGGVPTTSTQGNQEPVKEIPKNIFADVSDEYWGRDAIVFLTERNILNGKSKDLFCPEDYVTREEFTKMIVLAFCDIAEDADADFTDVDKNEWYYSYIAIAAKDGLITGYDDKTFGTGQRITRQDMAVILNRVAQVFNYGFKMPEYFEEFADNDSIAEYAGEAVYTLKDAGVIKGDGTNFNPTAFAQRAEAATIIYNMLSL
ncbi:MAG: S-layer homology domain-containing protein [Clostridia bacterium]|nr:S-layer homology domain-containing protein [Clostridia bacterium]